MSERYFQHTFPNGLALVSERMPAVQSAAMTLLLPAGAAGDPPDRCGSATVLSDLILRGAGSRDSRALTDYLDSLGLQRSSHVAVQHTRLSAAALAPRVIQALGAYADIVQRPMLPESGFHYARDLALQALASIEDEPRQKLLLKLREWHLPAPYGRPPVGRREHLEKLTLDFSRADHARRYCASGSILAIAGNIEFEQVRDAVERHFGQWNGRAPEPIEPLPPPGNRHHESQQSEQTHIGIACAAPPETHADYYVMRVIVEVLGGGMSGRLFTEIREKRGLCYHVSAGYFSLSEIGAVFGYAGTSNDRAQSTLDCFLDELNRIRDGITAEELERAKTGLKASTIMQGESTSSRAGAIAHDFFMRGRIRDLDEIKNAIDAVTLDQANEWLRQHPFGPFTIVTVGPKELQMPETRSTSETEI